MSTVRQRLKKATATARRAERLFKAGSCRLGKSDLWRAQVMASEMAVITRHVRPPKSLARSIERLFTTVDDAIEDAIVAEGSCATPRKRNRRR